MFLLEGTGNLPGRSVEIIPFRSATLKAPEMTWCLRSRRARGGGRGGASVADVLRMPCGTRRIRPIIWGMLSGRCFLIRSLESAGQVEKYPLSMALQKVVFGGKPAVA